ncbi:hypothetical protein GCM10020331_055040 [Ectobacillus funiculus]
MIKVKIMTGSAVPIAKRDGNAYPYADDKAKGISVPKNKNKHGRTKGKGEKKSHQECTNFFLA